MSLEEQQSNSNNNIDDDNNNAKLARTPSSLSSSIMTEDWDRSFTSTPQPNGDLALPGSGAATGAGAKEKDNNEDRNRRSLSDLMRLYGEQGKDLQLSAEEEKVLSEELGLWVSLFLLSIRSRRKSRVWTRPSRVVNLSLHYIWRSDTYI